MSRWYRSFPHPATLSQRQILAVSLAATVAPMASHVVLAPQRASHEQNRARHSHVYAPSASQRGAASLALEAAVTPPRTVTLVAAAETRGTARQPRDVSIIAVRSSALTNHALLAAGLPQTTHLVAAYQPRKQQHGGDVAAPRPSALTNHAILSAGLPQTIHVVDTRTPSRRARPAFIAAPRPSGLTFTPAAAATPPRTVWVIEAAQPPRARHRGSVVTPRPSGLTFTPAVVATPPQTIHVVQASTTRRTRTAPHVVAPRPRFSPTAPPPASRVVSQTPLRGRQTRLGDVITLRPLVVPAPAVTTPPRSTIIEAPQRRRSRLGRIIQLVFPRAAIAPLPSGASPPRTRATRSAGPRGRVQIHGSDGSTQTFGLGGATSAIGESGLTIASRGHGQPTRVCTLGYSNQVLGGVDPLVVESQIGRTFTGLRQNQAYTTTGWATAAAEYDAGRTLTYRSIQFDTAPGGWAGVAAGAVDSTILTTMANLRATGRWNATNPALICLHHEPTLSPFGTTGFLAADYIAMWEHLVPLLDTNGYTVHDRFGTYNPAGIIELAYVGWDRMFVGANGIGPPTAGQGYLDLDPDKNQPAGQSLYRYLGSDVYNAVDSPGVLRYGTDALTLLTPIVTAAAAKNKDFIIGEMGCEDAATTQDHTNKAAWLDSLRVGLITRGRHQPGVCRALLLTIKASAENYPVDSSAESLAAYQRLAASTYFK